MFLGEYKHSLDAKGRISIPVKFRSELGSSAIVTKGLEGCLSLYPKNVWENMAQRIASLPISSASARSFSRLMLSGAMEVEIDKLGRALLPGYLREYAGIDGEAVMAGLYNRVEIWDKKAWESVTKDAESRSGDIAEELKEKKDSVYLIYAFNATGKTRLSVAYKNVTKEPDTGRHVGVYYNAFSEDLFIWDNDEENDGVNIKLKILPSSLNQFHSFLYENTDNITDKLNLYSPDFLFKLAPYENPEKGIEFISFFHNSDDNNPIKISRGEERIFVWCFFLALLEVDGWANEQNAHIFIDDPVSSVPSNTDSLNMV